MISVVQLGTVDYAAGLRLQQQLVQLRKDGGINDVLLLLQHAPVITLGRNAKAANVLASPERLARRGVEIYDCDRGGDVTFHGPGQLVGYPIFDLRGFTAETGVRKTLGPVEFVRRLEEVIIRTCTEFRIPTQRLLGLTGVWTAETETQGKIAAIGVHISRGVTSHGFALNVNTDLSFFDLIIPCGIAAKPVTSMANELEAPLAMEEVSYAVSRNFGSVFGTQMLWVESIEALLGKTVGVPMRLPEELRRMHKEDESFLA